jgi:hypothetical protein
MVAAHSIPSVVLRRCSSVSWGSRATCSLASLSWWSCPQLGIDLLGAGSCLMFVLVSLLLIERNSIPSWGTAVHTMTVGMVWRVRVFFSTGVVVMGSVGVTTLRPRGMEDPELPPMLEAAPSSSEDSLRAVCKDGDPSCTIPMNTRLESHSWGERLRWPRRSTVNARLPKWMVLPRMRPTPVEWFPLATKESFGEGTIGTSRGKTRYKSPFLACQLLVFFVSTRYRGVKIARSCSEAVLRTTKHTMVYPDSGPSMEIIALRLAF